MSQDQLILHDGRLALNVIVQLMMNLLRSRPLEPPDDCSKAHVKF